MEHAQTWRRKVAQAADSARVTLLRAGRYDFVLFLCGGARGQEIVHPPAKHIFEVSFFLSSVKERHRIPFPGMSACAQTLIYQWQHPQD